MKSFFLVVLVTLLLGAAVVGYVATQPSLSSTQGSAAPDAAQAERMRVVVETLTKEPSWRDYRNTIGLNATADFIARELSAAGAAAERQRFTARGREYQNVIARFGPDTAEVIVVGAHYDAFEGLPAADDNASGVAGLIELARALSKASLTTRVELVAYANEEPPFFRTPEMGSAIHAKSLKAANKRARLMLSLECIGYFDDEDDSQDYPSEAMKAFYPNKANFLSVVGHYTEGPITRRVREAMRAATPLPIYSVNAPGIVAGVDFSDHLNYWNEGFVGLMVTDTAFMRNPNYHTADDTADTLDYERMSQVVQAVYAAVLAEANAKK
jgi:Zn-dependent M28 family amino/carboxypeptidase